MAKAIYAGTFNPWHKGHSDILEKALKVFGNVIVARGDNPDKDLKWELDDLNFFDWKNITFIRFHGLLVDYIEKYNEKNQEDPITSVVRGLRSGYDLAYEMNQQYWNEDLGLKVPVVYFVADRNLAHISSSAIRQVSMYRSCRNI